MALWRYTLEYPDGKRVTNLLAAGNQDAARERAERNARQNGARLVGALELKDSFRGSL